MGGYRIGDIVEISNCKYEVKENYLSAKSAGHYPKVLAKMLGINNIDQFVDDTLGYCRYEGKIFGYDGMEDCNKLVNALQNFKGVSAPQSYLLNDIQVKNFFDNDTNLSELSYLIDNIGELLNNFNNIRNISTNVINKVSEKNSELVNAIDCKNIKSIKKLSKEFTKISEFISETNTVLARLNEIGKANSVEPTEFNAEEFMTA